MGRGDRQQQRTAGLPMAGDHIPANFSWIFPGVLAGSGCPQSELQLRALVGVGCTLLVTLSPESEPRHSVRHINLRNELVDWKEFQGVSLSQLTASLDLVHQEISGGGAV